METIKKFFSENKWLLLILLVGFIFTAHPSFIYDLPVVQTDGASYYGFAKVYAETGDFNAKNPAWNQWATLEEKVSDYVPFFTITMAFLIKFVGHDVFWLNGFYLAIFFVFANVFIYLLALELAKERKNKKTIALLVTLFSILNVRAYYTIFAGQFPEFIAFCFTIPVLYYTVKYLNDKKIKYFFLAVVFTILAAISYMQQALYIVVLQLFIFIGYLISEKIKIDWPKINISTKNIDFRDLKKMWLIVIPTLAIFLAVFLNFAFRAPKRASLFSDLISSYMKPIGGYQAIWKIFLIMDGPILVILGLIGLFVLIYRNDWKLVLFLSGGLFIVLVGVFIMATEPNMKQYIYRFYVMFYLFIALSASVLFAELIENKKVGKIFKSILVLAVVMQLLMCVLFFSIISPAISKEEYSVSLFLSKDNNAKVLYVVHDEWGTFSAFKWVLVYAQSNNYGLSESIPADVSSYKYIYVVNKEVITEDAKSSLKDYKLIANGSRVQLYRLI